MPRPKPIFAQRTCEEKHETEAGGVRAPSRLDAWGESDSAGAEPVAIGFRAAACWAGPQASAGSVSGCVAWAVTGRKRYAGWLPSYSSRSF